MRFFEQTPDGVLLWESFGEFGLNDVHKQYAISLRVPRYKTLEVSSTIPTAGCPYRFTVRN